jgi:hypothetical protein
VWCGFDFICFGFKIYFENGFENKKNMKKINNMNNSPFFLFGLVAWLACSASSLGLPTAGLLFFVAFEWAEPSIAEPSFAGPAEAVVGAFPSSLYH